MNDQCQLMNQYQVMNQSQSYKTNPSQQMMNQSQSSNQFQMLHSEIVNQPPQMMNLMVGQAQMIPQPSMMNQSMAMPQIYGNLAHQPHNLPPMSNLKFPNPNYGGGVKKGRGNWKGKKIPDNRRKDVRSTASVGYNPPSLNELEKQNRLKAGRFNHKKKFNRMGPYAHAPRNTTSYLIRAKKEGGIASLVSPCPVTPAVLPTPIFSPSREALVDMAKEEWGVDGYGSMKGLIRLRSSPGHEAEMEMDDDEDDVEGDSSESDVEEHLEVERRLDHDLSRFEMVYPMGSEALGNRVDDQDTQILQLEEENLFLKERLYLMERELGEIKKRMQLLERSRNLDFHEEELVQNVSGNESEGTAEKHGGIEGEASLEEEHQDENSHGVPKGHDIGNVEAAKDLCVEEDIKPHKETENVLHLSTNEG